MKNIMNIKRALGGAFLIGFLGISQAANFTVDQIFDGADATPGDGICATGGGSCTLRAAVMETNALAGADTISIPVGTYSLALGNTGEDLATEGDLDILDDLIITGADAATTIVNGNGFQYRIFSILKRADDSLPVVAINKLTLTQGLSDTNGALIYNAGELSLDDITLTDASPDSWAMFNEGNFTMSNSRVTGNESGIYNEGNSVITSSIFSNNITVDIFKAGAAFYTDIGSSTIIDSQFFENEGGAGSAIYHGGNSLTIRNCNFDRNQANAHPTSSSGGAVASFGSKLVIESSTFNNNSANNSGGAIYLGTFNVSILESIFTNNTAIANGGAIYTNAQNVLAIKRVTVSGNQATSGDGGGIYARFIQSLMFTESLVSNNTSGGFGGGIALLSRSPVSNVLNHIEISNNTAISGGGVFLNNDGGRSTQKITIENTTISNNTATGSGGGIYHNEGFFNESLTELIQVTISNNTAPVVTGSNLHNESGIIRLSNTLIANPVNGTNCGGNITTLGYNLSSDASCGLGVEGDQSGIAPLLSALADNGGFNKTHALQVGSPAINGGSSVACATLNPIDQRFNYRSDTTCDIGAFEFGSTLAQTGTLGFSTAAYSVNEGDGTATITISRTGGSQGIVSVPFFDVGVGTATAFSIISDFDYLNITPERLEWIDGDSIDKTFDITINDDSLFEDDETILLALENRALVYGGASLGSSAATLTIVDNDVPGEVQFSSATYSVNEGGSFIEIFVDRLNGNTAASIDYATSDGTAVTGIDYTETSGTLNFSTTGTSQSFFVNVADNALTDGNRTINLTLSNPQDGLTLGTTTSAVITIVDDEAGLSGGIQFANSGITVNEADGTGTATVTRINGSTGTVTIDYIANFDLLTSPATNGTDFNLTAGTLTFADGVTSQTITFSIIDDLLQEGDEDFWIDLSNVTGGATLDTQWFTLVTIADNDNGTVITDPGVISLETSLYAVSESVGTLTFNLLRTGGTDGAVTVDVTFEDGSALFGADYSASSQSFTVTFQNGESSISRTVLITDDSFDELEESFIIRIGNPQGGATLGTITGAAVVIADNDGGAVSTGPGTISLENATYSVSEGLGTLSFNVIRTGGTDGAVEVDLDLIDGSATFGNDYGSSVNGVNSSSITLTFLDGISTQSGIISILEDSIDEGNETFSIMLSNPASGATLGTNASSTVTITDNDSTSSSNSGGGGSLHPALLFGLLLLTAGLRRRKQS